MMKKMLTHATVALCLLLTGFLVSCSNSDEQPSITTTTLPVSTTEPAPATPTTIPNGSQTSASLVIDSTTEESRVELENRLGVVIPASTFPVGTSIAINEIDQLAEHEFSGFSPRGLFEITASAAEEFSAAVTLEFAFDPGEFNSEYDINDQIAVAFYDEVHNAWQEVDFELDEGRGIILVETSHFSLWSYFFTDEKQVIMKMPGFTIYFNQELNAPIITSGMSGQPIFEYVAIIRSGLYDAYEAYGDAGFKLPQHTRVYIDDWGHDKEAEWGWFSKNIEIPVSYIYEDELIMVAAHEFFHSVQNQYVNFYTMSADRWWMEATADYAAAYVASSYGLKEKLPHDYINTALNSGETFHMYQTAHFVKYLADQGLPFRELFEGVMSGSGRALPNLNAFVNTKGQSLAELYDSFACQTVFNVNNYTESLKADIYTDLVKNKKEYNLDSSTTEAETVNVNASYSSTLSGFKMKSKTDEDFTLGIRAIDPTSGARVQYVLASNPQKGSVISRGYLDTSKIQLEVSNDQYLYFLVTNFTPQNGYVTVVIEKEELRPQPYSHTRSASVYNNEYILDIEFNMIANKHFTVVEETVEGDALFVVLEFKKSASDIIIDLETITSELSFTSPQPDRKPLIGEEYWAWPGTKTENNTAQIVISPGDNRPPGPYYDIIIRVENTNTGTISPKIDGATIIRLAIFIV